ncbi:MAG TPA: amidohydrolase family protein [Gammaproteobacteria bacterium]
MRQRRLLRGLLLCAGLTAMTFAGAVGAQTGRPRAIALVGGTLIDGSGGTPLHDSVVLIRGERIERVGTLDTLSVPQDYERISTEGMTVLPGLFDLHVHLLYNGHPDVDHWFAAYAARFEEVTIPASAEQTLLAGVTSVRDLAAPTDAILAVKQRIDRGELPGPTIYASGAAIQPTEAPTRPHILAVSGPDDAAAKTKQLAQAGVDLVKILGAEGRPLEEIRAIVDAAHAAGLKVAAHGRSDAEIRIGLAAGVDEFEHIGVESDELPPDVVAAIAERVATGPPLYWCATVGVLLNGDELAADHEFLDDPRHFAGLPPEIADDVRRAVAKAEIVPPPPRVAAVVERKIEQLRELGVRFVVGSDMGTFGLPAAEALWRELEAWVRELGMPPMEAVRWATADAAEYLGVGSDYGTIVPGKFADIIAVRGNPLLHIDVLRDPAIVLKHGKRYK